MGANRPWQFVANQMNGRTGQLAGIYPALVNKCDVGSKERTHLQSTDEGASLVNPGRGSMITVT